MGSVNVSRCPEIGNLQNWAAAAPSENRVCGSDLSLHGPRRPPDSIVALRKDDWRKRVIGRAIRRSTVVPLAWIAEALIMGDAKHTATLVRTDPDPASGPEWKPARKLLSEITKTVD